MVCTNHNIIYHEHIRQIIGCYYITLSNVFKIKQKIKRSSKRTCVELCAESLARCVCPDLWSDWSGGQPGQTDKTEKLVVFSCIPNSI